MKWTRRFREKREPEPERASRLGILGLALALFVIGFAYAYPRLTPRPRRDFDGRIVEKYVALGESRIGSVTRPRLVVESADGRRFTVGVSDEEYERAQVGMWLSRREDELILSRDEPARRAPDGKGGRMEAR